MPYTVRPQDPRCPTSRPWSVVKQADNTLIGCHETKQDAVDQLVALQLAEEKHD